MDLFFLGIFERIYTNFLNYEFFSTFKKIFFKLYPKRNRDNINIKMGIISFNLSTLKKYIYLFLTIFKIKSSKFNYFFYFIIE